MVKMNVAAIQMNCVLGDKQQNLQNAGKYVAHAIDQHAKIIVLPELFNTGYRVEEHDLELAEPVPGPTTEWMAAICAERNVFMIGCLLENSIVNGMIFDTAVVVGPQGLIGSYRKTHLWDSENTRWAKGHQFPVFDLGFVRVGVQICYEVGFPEGARILALKGADIVVYPSAFGRARLYAWDIATRSRSLENGIYVVAANRSGTEKEATVFGGTSRIVDPQGTVLTEAAQENQVIIAEIDLDRVARQRRTIPYLRDLNKQTLFNELTQQSR